MKCSSHQDFLLKLVLNLSNKLNNEYLNDYYFVEIPLYHISNAQITFGNLFGTDKAIEGVQTLDSNGKMFCVVEDSVFFPPRSYVVLGKI